MTPPSDLDAIAEDARKPGHQRPCYICSHPCDALAGNPSKWPVLLPVVNGNGISFAHHMGCVAQAVEHYLRTGKAEGG